jgi:hypothetical protein
VAALLLALLQIPLDDGARWVYRADGREAAVVDSLGGGELRVRGPFLWASERLKLSRDGRSILAIDGRDCAEPRPLFGEGSEWAHGSTGAVFSYRVTVGRRGRVVVPAGTFQAVPIDYVFTELRGRAHDLRAWFAPGVGFVKIQELQLSTSGGKRPVDAPRTFELASFRACRDPLPGAWPALSEDERLRAHGLVTRLGSDAKAADLLVVMGRGVIPVLLERRAEAVLKRFEGLEAVLRLSRDTIKVGEPLPAEFLLRNAGPRVVKAPLALDASDLGRYPRIAIEIRDEKGELQTVPSRRTCGVVNRLLARDFVEIVPGEELDVFGPGTFRHRMLGWRPTAPGRYTITWSYDSSGEVPAAWESGCSRPRIDPEAVPLLEKMPRGRVVSKTLTLQVAE